MDQMLPGETVLWQGRPAWRAVARDVMHVGWIAAYLAVMLIWGFASDRSAGLGPVDTLLGGVPLMVLGLGVLGACAGFAWAIARTTTYIVTTERCILHYGVALTATLSLPLRRVGAVSVAAAADGAGDIPLTMKPGSGLRYTKLWPHARPWRRSPAQPMLRGVPDAAAVAMLISQAAAALSPGVLHAAPAPGKRDRVAAPGVILPAAGD